MFKHLVRAAISSIFFVVFFCCFSVGQVNAATCTAPKFFTTSTDRGNGERTLTGYNANIESIPDGTPVYIAYELPSAYVLDIIPYIYLCRSDRNQFSSSINNCEGETGLTSSSSEGGVGYDADGRKYYFKRFESQDIRWKNYTQINFSRERSDNDLCSTVVQKDGITAPEESENDQKCEAIGYTAKYNFENDPNKILVTFFANGSFAKGSSSKQSDYHIVLGQSGMNAPRFSYPMEWVSNNSSAELGTSFVIDKNSVRGVEGTFFWDAPPALSVGLKQGSQASSYCADLKNGKCTLSGCFKDITPDPADKWAGEDPRDVTEAGLNAGETSPDVPFDMCAQIVVPKTGPDSAQKSKIRNTCCACITGVSGSTFDTEKGECDGKGSGAEGVESGLYTAVGCIPSSGTGIIAALVRLGLGIAGGVALLMILAAGFMLSTSRGEPKKAGEAKELITSAVMGLLFIIFSVTILQFIGVTILQIPGFGK